MRQRDWTEHRLSVSGELHSWDPCVLEFYSPKKTGHPEGEKKGKRIVCNYREDPEFLPETGSWPPSLRKVGKFPWAVCGSIACLSGHLCHHFIRKIAIRKLELCPEILDSTIAVHPFFGEYLSKCSPLCQSRLFSDVFQNELEAEDPSPKH